MPDPIHVENTFQKLVEELEQVESIRQRISLIREFIFLLEGNYRKYESYLVQLIQHWPVYSGPITYSGISPSEITNDLRLLEDVSNETKAVVEQQKFADITTRLREVAVILYTCIGEVQSAFKLLNQWSGKELNYITKEDEDSLNSRQKLFRDFNDLKRVLNSDIFDQPANKIPVKVGRILQDVEYILKEGEENEVLVPVVESFESLRGKKKWYGRLRRLKVAVNDEIGLQSDHIVRRYSVVGVEKPLWLEDSKVSLAARSLLKKFSPGNKIGNYEGEIFYEYSGAIHRGNSSNAATAALWFTGLQKKADLRERYQLNRDIIITGDIDKNGDLLPVSETSIKAKVHAAFYSWATFLIVPAFQAELFRTELSKLKEKHPGKELTLLGTQRLDELFYDRRISMHLNPSKVRYFAGRMWEKKFETVGLVTILLLSLVIFRLAYGPLDKNPVLYEFSGEVLRVLNKGGALIEEIYVGESTVRKTENKYIFELVDFADITGNGIQEILWAEASSNPTGKIFMKEVGEKDNSWEHKIHYNFTFPNKPYVFESSYTPRKIVTDDFNNDGELELLLNSSHSRYFPGGLSLRSATTGEEISHFVHPGRIYDFTLLDLTGDGKLEVVLCGVNNSYNQAFLAILNIDNIDGYGPSTEEYRLDGYETADFISYMLFPKTIVANAITTNSYHNQAERIQYNEEYELLEVYLSDFRNYADNELKRIERAPLFVYINTDLTIRGIGTSDGYDESAEFLYNNGTLNRYPDHEYFDEYQSTFLYWDGEDFIKKNDEQE